MDTYHFYQHVHQFNRPTWYERCALILWHEKTDRWSLREVPNHHEDPEHAFAIRNEDVQRVLDLTGCHVAGFVHTHNEPGCDKPSSVDLEQAAKFSTYFHAIYYVPDRCLVWYSETGVVCIEYVRRLRARPVVIAKEGRYGTGRVLAQ